MRHLAEVADHRLAFDALAKSEGQGHARAREFLRVEQVAQIDGLARRVRQFDTYGVAARDNGDTRGGGGHGACDVFGERDDFRRADAGRGLKFEQGDDGAGAHFRDAALDAELGQYAAETISHLEQAGFIDVR